MVRITDSGIHDLLATLTALLLCGYGLFLLYRLLRRSRPELSLGLPLLAALALRLVTLVALPLTGLEGTLRGGDEVAFLANARETAGTSLGSGAWLDSLTGSLHEFVFATQIALVDPPDLSLRVTQLTIAVVGLLLLAVAVYDLAGGRAAAVAMWLLAVEPSNIFFSTYLHKEPNMMLAAGLVVFAGTSLWKRQELRWIAVMAVGCLIAVATRPYAGWFLIAGAAAIILHAGLRAGVGSRLRGATLIAVVVLFSAIAAPTVLEASTDESLAELQSSQDANAASQSNLSLEQVDFSTRGGIITNLPRRIVDVLTQPYPWQLGNTSQQLGALGALIAFAVLGVLVRELRRARGAIFKRAGPIVYVGLGLLAAYSLSAGNAGTSFRYRTHLIELAVCAVVVLDFVREQAPAPAAARHPPESRTDRHPSPV